METKRLAPQITAIRREISEVGSRVVPTPWGTFVWTPSILSFMIYVIADGWIGGRPTSLLRVSLPTWRNEPIVQAFAMSCCYSPMQVSQTGPRTP